MDLRLAVDEEGGWTILRVHGDLDMATAPQLRSRIVDVLSPERPRLVVDLEAVDFVDSLGLGVLVGGLKRARGLGGDLRVVSTREHLRRILALTGLDAVLGLAATTDDAMADGPAERG